MRRDDEEVEAENVEILAENVEVENKGVNQEDNEETDFVWEQVEEVLPENENVEQEGQVQGEMKEKEAEVQDSGSGEKFYDDVDGIDERQADEDVVAPAVPVAPAVLATPPVETNVQ
ncbi:hypothetical protein Dimus_030668 [Dionaea muscipula]